MQARAEQPKRLTIEEFYAQYGHLEAKYELAHGIPVLLHRAADDEGETEMMAGGLVRHGLVARNVLSALDRKLVDGPCVAVGSDVQLRLAKDLIRLPDVAIYCDPEELAAIDDDTKEMTRPKVVIEVLSPSTRRYDRSAKLIDYREASTIELIVYIDPRNRSIETYRRVSEREWLNTHHLPGADLVLRDPAVTLTAAEIFRGL